MLFPPVLHQSRKKEGCENSLQVLLEPLQRLQEGVLLGVLLDGELGVASHGEPVRDAAVQIDLVGIAEVLQDILGLDALLLREDRVRFWGVCGSPKISQCT